ncbi:hypothetical protein FKR81_19320 [Lentzea tibetensis]|uniref:Uncharacterized protein n=1 Tax=Lentzea tibetensis TaxID=2591470 RepID=A0A563ESS3_9PSEU|nr:hypothetical protein [Lentzea tibetensis]TWP50757.1 hypothetical protein FKR81_19320 [Lentzea tibetensis]
MLEAKRVSLFRNRYELAADGMPLASWDGRFWSTGGTLELDGRRFDVKASPMGRRYQMTDETGAVVAEADRVGRKDWTVTADGRTYRFQRAAWWSTAQQLLSDGQPVGSVRRVGPLSSNAVAELPTLPLPTQVFVVAVVLTLWAQQDASSG